MKVLVCGGRDYQDVNRVFDELDAIHSSAPITQVIWGGARGADTSGMCWAHERHVEHRVFMADWATHRRAAGPIRNEQMLREGKPDLVVAFPGGRGTAHMVQIAERAGVPVKRIV